MRRWGGAVWKMVDLEHAPAVEAGGLKIGRLHDYEAIENGRADPLDGAVQFVQGPRDSLWAENPEDLPALAQMGLLGTEVAEFNVVTRRSAPCYALCCAKVGCTYDPNPGTAKVIFEISDIRALGELLAARNSERLKLFEVAEVAYLPRRGLNPRVMVPEAHPHLKDESFRPEQEVRIVFDVQPGSPYETIITGSDAEIAALIRPVKEIPAVR